LNAIKIKAKPEYNSRESKVAGKELNSLLSSLDCKDKHIKTQSKING
jgi:hypothetical protein